MSSGSAADAMLLVGKITSCYGIKGWVRIHSYTDPPDNILALGGWQIKRRGAYEAIEIDEGRHHGKGLVAHIVGVDDRTAAEGYRGLQLWVPERALPELAEGEYYWRQLLGLEVWCVGSSDKRDKVLLGRVDHLLETGAHDVLVIKPCAGSLDEEERLIPYAPGNTVTSVDLEAARMEVDWFLDV